RRRRRQGEAHAAHVHRRRPRHDAGAALRLRPRRHRQPRQGVPHAAAVRGRPRAASRCAPAQRGRRRGGVLMTAGGTTERTAPDLTRLADALRAHGGEVREAGPGDAVDGVPAAAVVRPTSAEGVAAVLREATAQGLATVARGGGTALDWGAPPERADLLLDTTGLARLAEHGAGDLVVVAEAGLPVAALLDAVGRSAQELVADLPPER